MGQDLTHDSARIVPNRALPHPEDDPAVVLRDLSCGAIPTRIVFHLVRPKFRVRPAPWLLSSVDRASMPEAAVYENSETARWKHEVRCAPLGDPFMESEPSAGGMHCAPKVDLGCRVLLASSSEVPTFIRRRPLFRHASNVRRPQRLTRRFDSSQRHEIAHGALVDEVSALRLVLPAGRFETRESRLVTLLDNRDDRLRAPSRSSKRISEGSESIRSSRLASCFAGSRAERGGVRREPRSSAPRRST